MTRNEGAELKGRLEFLLDSSRVLLVNENKRALHTEPPFKRVKLLVSIRVASVSSRRHSMARRLQVHNKVAIEPTCHQCVIRHRKLK